MKKHQMDVGNHQRENLEMEGQNPRNLKQLVKQQITQN